MGAEGEGRAGGSSTVQGRSGARECLDCVAGPVPRVLDTGWLQAQEMCGRKSSGGAAGGQREPPPVLPPPQAAAAQGAAGPSAWLTWCRLVLSRPSSVLSCRRAPVCSAQRHPCLPAIDLLLRLLHSPACRRLRPGMRVVARCLRAVARRGGQQQHGSDLQVR